MKNWQKGQIAEHKVIIRAMEKGVILSQPTVEDIPYDFILDENGKLSKVQVKWANQEPRNSNGAVIANLRTRRGGGSTRYEIGAFDLLLVYIPKIDCICAFGPEHFAGKAMLNIRLQPSKSNQTKGCLMAENFQW